MFLNCFFEKPVAGDRLVFGVKKKRESRKYMYRKRIVYFFLKDWNGCKNQSFRRFLENSEI